MVEHDEDTIRAADHADRPRSRAPASIGGEVVAEGTIDEIAGTTPIRSPGAISATTLRDPGARGAAPARSGAAPPHHQRAREQPPAASTVEIPLGCFVSITGVSGSGKSTLVTDILYQTLARHFYRAKVLPGAHDRIEGLDQLDKVIDIDQSPIGRTPRSNPATYSGLFTPIRELFTQLPEAKMRGYGPGRFSFNVKGGRCEACQGDGLVKIEMHFLPDVYVPCEVCKGRRYNRETLEVRYKGKSIADVLELTVADAMDFFSAQTRIAEKLSLLNDVGLGYLHLGQAATTLSGGEAQRVKLATELAKRDTGRTLYILDEPTTGLHFEDVRLLLEVLHRLVDKGNTRGRDRAQPRRDQDLRLGRGPRPGGRRARRHHRRGRHARRGGAGAGIAYRPIPRPDAGHSLSRVALRDETRRQRRSSSPPVGDPTLLPVERP
ncbi:MAG: ATP-binding cassette domain-containing protein [Gemmatimonadales bacterium]